MIEGVNRRPGCQTPTSWGKRKGRGGNVYETYFDAFLGHCSFDGM